MKDKYLMCHKLQATLPCSELDIDVSLGENTSLLSSHSIFFVNEK